MEFAQRAYLEVILGPMFSGKTSRLLEIYKKYIFCNSSICVINHSNDTIRYSKTMLSTHDGTQIPCIHTETLSELWNNLVGQGQHNVDIKSFDVILINEGQFFPDLYRTVVDMLAHNKTVYVCGLDGDYKREKFGQILDLIPICDKVEKLNAFCALCKNGTPGIFSLRTSTELEQCVVGDSGAYMAVCRKCYCSLNNII